MYSYKWFLTFNAVFLSSWCNGLFDEKESVSKEIETHEFLPSAAITNIKELLNSISSYNYQNDNSNSNATTPVSSRANSGSTSEEIYQNYLTPKMPSMHSLLEQLSQGTKNHSSNMLKSSSENSTRILFLQAIQLGYKNLVLRLLQQGQDPTEADAAGSTPLHLAVMQGDPQVVEWLIKAGAEINAIDTTYIRNALFLAMLKHNIQLVELLLQHNSLTESPNGTHYLQEIGGSTAHKVALAEVFIAYNALPAKLTEFAYVKEAQRRQEDLVAKLSSNNLAEARLMIQQGYYCSPLVKSMLSHVYNLFLHALEKDDVDRVASYYKKGVSLTIKDAQGNTPLHRAVILKRYKVIAYLLEVGVPVTIANNAGKTPFNLILNSERVLDTIILNIFLNYAYKNSSTLEMPTDTIFTLQDSDSDSDSIEKCCCIGDRNSSDSDVDTTRTSKCIIE